MQLIKNIKNALRLWCYEAPIIIFWFSPLGEWWMKAEQALARRQK